MRRDPLERPFYLFRKAGVFSKMGFRDNGRENGNYYIVYGGYIGIMAKHETTV